MTKLALCLADVPCGIGFVSAGLRPKVSELKCLWCYTRGLSSYCEAILQGLQRQRLAFLIYDQVNAVDSIPTLAICDAIQ